MSELGYTIFGQPFLGSSDNAGFLYVKPSFQVWVKSFQIFMGQMRFKMFKTQVIRM